MMQLSTTIINDSY